MGLLGRLQPSTENVVVEGPISKLSHPERLCDRPEQERVMGMRPAKAWGGGATPEFLYCTGRSWGR